MPLDQQIYASRALSQSLLSAVRDVSRTCGVEDTQRRRAIVLADLITPDHVRAYAKHMATTFDLAYVTDEDQGLKEEIRKAVRMLFPTIDIDNYLQQWAFTVDRLIWLPYSLENPKPEPRAPLAFQIMTLAHEAMHRLQARGQFEPFAWDYLTNEESRGQYEYEAYRVSLELNPVLYGGAQVDIDSLISPLRHYGLSDATIAFVTQQLRSAADIVRRGGVIGATSKETISWLAQNVGTV